MEEIPVENYKYEGQYLKSRPKKTAKPLCWLQDNDASNFTDFTIQAEVTYPTNSKGKGKTKHQYSEVTVTSIFNAYIAIINSEREVIWQRYSVLLVANAIVASFLGTGFGYEARLTDQEVSEPYWTFKIIGGICFGLCLCIVWGFMNWRGWSAFEAYIKAAREFTWQIRENGVVTHDIKNPLEVHFQNRDEEYQWYRIRNLSRYTIVLFIIVYILIFLLYWFGGALFITPSTNPNVLNSCVL